MHTQQAPSATTVSEATSKTAMLFLAAAEICAAQEPTESGLIRGEFTVPSGVLKETWVLGADLAASTRANAKRLPYEIR